MVGRQSYQLSRLTCLIRAFSCSVYSTPQRLQFNDLIAECKEILTDMVKMLESKVVEIVEDSELEAGPEVVTELVSLQEVIFFTVNESCRVAY